MRNINLRYVDEAYDENGLLTKFDITMPDNFNFAYDVVDDIAINDPERTAMVWCNPEGEEHTFTFADMKTWSDKTANFMADCGIGRGETVGTLEAGKQADLVIWNAPNMEMLCYRFGSNMALATIKKGILV